MSRVCRNDGSFGPAIIGSCRGGFDFTLVFEDSILGLLPQAALLLLTPVRLATLRRRKDRVAKNSHLGFLKTVTGLCYAATSIVLLALWCEIETYKTKLSVASASVEFLGSLSILALSRLEHSRAVRPSHLLQFFLLVLLICDAIHLRTLYLMDYPVSLVTPASIHTFLTGLLLLLESLDKRELFISDQARRLSPEETIGLFGKRTLWFLNGLFKQGYRKILKPADLHDIDTDLTSKERAAAFKDSWERQDKSKSNALRSVIVKVLWLDLMTPVLPRLIQMGTSLSQPFLITAMIQYIEDRDKPDTANVGYGLIAAFALNYAILAIASSWCAQSVARFSTKLRGCLISLIYEKSLHKASKDVDLGAATVLMNVDAEKISNGVKHMHEVWACLVNAGVALYILYTHLGAAFVSPFLTILATTAFATWVGKHMRVRQLRWSAATQNRVNTISYVVGCIKGVKMLGLSDTVFRMLTKMRVAEVEAHKYIRKILLWILLISNATFQLTTLVTYFTFAIIKLTNYNGTGLDFNTLYGSLSALKLVTTPLMVVLQTIPMLQASLASLDRIEAFLRSESVGLAEILPGQEGIELQSIRNEPFKTPKLVLEKATFAIDEQPILLDISTEFKPRSFTMVIGKVASGKSVLLRSLVGETTLLSGNFSPSTTGVAFCDQAVWLRNVTVRENIIGEDKADDSWYYKVLWSCNLLPDLETMKKGDHTLIGSKGISLSGGQKNRVSLARALYARKPFLVIDDMLAGLDNTTEKLVFDRVFGPNGLLRKSNATVVLATHATYYSRYADQIIVLEDGRIVDKGTYGELSKRKLDFRFFDDGNGGETNPTHLPDDSEGSVKMTYPHKSSVEEEEEDQDIARQAGDWKSMMFFLKAIGPLHVSLYWGLLVINTVVSQIQFLWLKWWSESKDTSKHAAIRNLYLFVIITLINVLTMLTSFWHCTLWFLPRISLNLHASQLKALMQAKFSWLVSEDIGSITNRFSQDIVIVDNNLANAWINVTFEGLTLVASIVIMVVATPPVAATIPLLGAIGYCIQRVYLRTSRQVRTMDLEAKAPLCTNFLESLAGIVTIRAFGWAQEYSNKNAKLLDASQIPFYLLASIQNWLNLVVELMAAGLITVTVGLAVGLRGKIDPGYLGLALVSAMDIGFSFKILIMSWTDLETCFSAVTRIRQFVNTPSETSHQIAQADPPASWPLHGSVAFRNFAASYADNGKPVLKGIDLDIKAGEKVGLCGRTGSGKSSLVATLFGLLHQQGGEVLIDDVPIQEVELSVLRSKIIALPQEAFFVQGSVRENLSPWQDGENRPLITDDQMREALEQVQLWDKLSTATEPGQSALDSSLNNADSLFSQGEKQLFCLARAILMPGKIVVLDEPTSSVDAETDALMQRVFRAAFASRTLIAIAHRLDTIMDFDRVVVMDTGSIVETGNPQTLMQTEGSLFRGLVESQGLK